MFSYLPLLPFELRYQIWGLAANEEALGRPCIHRVREKSEPRCAIEFLAVRDNPNRPVPTLTQVCREARTVAEEEYVLWPCGPILNGWNGHHAWVSKRYDVLYFEEGARSRWLFVVLGKQIKNLPSSFDYARIAYGEHWWEPLPRILRQINDIQHLAFHWGIWYRLLAVGQNPLQWLDNFPSLETLTVTLVEGKSYWVPLELLEPSNSLWGDVAEFLRLWITSDLHLYATASPNAKIPYLRVMVPRDAPPDTTTYLENGSLLNSLRAQHEQHVADRGRSTPREEPYNTRDSSAYADPAIQRHARWFV